MEITNATRALVTQALRDKDLKQSDLTKKIGVNRSWATRFFREKGGMKTLDDDLRWKIEDFLGIKFFSAVPQSSSSELAIRFDAALEKDPRLADSMALLLSSIEDDHYFDLPFIPTKDLVEFGKEIMKAAHEDPDKPGKVGRIAVEWLSGKLAELKP